MVDNETWKHSEYFAIEYEYQKDKWSVVLGEKPFVDVFEALSRLEHLVEENSTKSYRIVRHVTKYEVVYKSQPA